MQAKNPSVSLPRVQRGYDGIRSNPSFDGYNFVMPLGDYSKVLKVRVRPIGMECAYQTIAFVCTRRRDGHKTLYVCGTDGKIHKYVGKFPQCKHVKIPTLAQILGIGRNYDIRLNGQKITEHMGDYNDYAGKAKPHAARLRHRSRC